MKLKAGQRYDIDKLQCLDWTEGDGSGHEGYNWRDYFDARGIYQGPDPSGIEPVLETMLAGEAAMKQAEITEGMRVEAGEGDDYDTGIVHSINAGTAVVGWDSGVVTAVPIGDLRTTTVRYSGGHPV